MAMSSPLPEMGEILEVDGPNGVMGKGKALVKNHDVDPKIVCLSRRHVVTSSGTYA